MKKSNKKIPKTHLPKYLYGDEVPMNQQSSYNPNVNPMYRTNDSGMGPNGQADAYQTPSATSEGTQNIYNQGRAKSNMLGTNQKLTGNQYAQMGQAVAQGGMQAYQTSQTPGLSEYEKNQQYGKSIKSAETGVVSAINPIFGMIHSGVTAATAPLTAKATQTDEQGNLKNENFAKADIIGQGFADPMAMIPTMISNKFSMKKYISSVEDDAKGKIAAQKAQEDAYAQQQTDYQNQQQSMMDAAFARGYANQNQTGGNTYVQYAKYGGQMKYTMGGMKPNAEVENNEMITSDTPPQVFNNGGVELASNNPYGTPTYKTNGASHENGGIPMNMAPGSIVNGKTKNPLTGNKFTKDIDILAKQENKFTKKAETGDKYSKINAKLILPILAQKKDYLNNLQNAIIANKEQAKALRNGQLPQPSMDNEQMEPQGKMAMGGVQLPYYNTDNAGNPIYAMGGGYPAMTNPYHNFKGSIPMYPDGGVNAQGLTKPQYEQAQRDSSVIYKSGLTSTPNWQFPGFTESSMREGLRINPRSPMIKTVKGQQYGSDAGVNMMDSESSNFSNFKPTMVPWKEYIPRTKDAGVDVKNVKPGMHPKYDHYIPGIEKSRQPVIIEQYSKGGKKSAKVPESLRFVPKMADESEGDNVVVPGVPQYETNYTDVLPPDRYNTFGKPLDNWEAARLNKSAWDEDYMNNPNAKKPIEETDPNSKNFDWGNLAMNVGNFAGQNMGNIYDLSRKNAPLQKYDRATASYLDATAAMRDANEQTRRAEYNIRGASGGNAGTYLANRVGLNAQNIMTKDRIRQQYANANAGIANQTNQFNTEIAYREAEARAKDAAMKENIRSQAIHGIGTSFGKATKSGKQDEMDQKTLEMYKQYYNNPQFRAALKKAGYDV